jgi:sugar lactone lactonase YvrE
VPEQVTSVAFAGSNLDLLVATTATEFWTDEQRATHPTAGLLHSTPAPAGVVGRAATPWQPIGKWWNK